jgi:hypothetical protein
MWCWRRKEKISWTDRVTNKAVLHTVREQRNILHTVKRRKANWIGHILRRNCLLKHVIEGKVERRIKEKGRRGGRRKQLLYDLMENRRHSELEKGRTRLHSVEKSIWKRLWTCRKHTT